MPDARSPAPHAEAIDRPGMPRWVKVSAAITLAIAVVLITGLIVGKGDHGPGRHAPPSVTEAHVPPDGMDHAPPSP